MSKLQRALVLARSVFSCLPVATLLTILMAHAPALADRARVATLIEYCRALNSAISLSADKSILCYDGQIPFWIDLTPFRDLSDGGVFVVRSPGGNIVSAVKAANVLRDKQATVVIYDYCLSACANAFFVATGRTLVADNAIIAWHGGVEGCRGRATADPSDQENIEVEDYCANSALLKDFFLIRGLDDDFTARAQTPHTRQAVYQAKAAASHSRNVFWMWHPRNHGDYFRGVTYYRYPASQDEVDFRIRALRDFRPQIIYDVPIYRFGADVAADRTNWCGTKHDSEARLQ